MLCKENVAFYWLACESVQLFPPANYRETALFEKSCNLRWIWLFSYTSRTLGNAGRRRTRPCLSLWALRLSAPRCPETSHLTGGWRCGARWRSYGHPENPSSRCILEPSRSECLRPWGKMDRSKYLLHESPIDILGVAQNSQIPEGDLLHVLFQLLLVGEGIQGKLQPRHRTELNQTHSDLHSSTFIATTNDTKRCNTKRFSIHPKMMSIHRKSCFIEIWVKS